MLNKKLTRIVIISIMVFTYFVSFVNALNYNSTDFQFCYDLDNDSNDYFGLNNATEIGTVSYNGSVMSIDGTNDYLNSNQIGSLSNSINFTYVSLIYFNSCDDLPSNDQFFGYYDGSSDRVTITCLPSNKLRAHAGDYSGGGVLSVDTGVGVNINSTNLITYRYLNTGPGTGNLSICINLNCYSVSGSVGNFNETVKSIGVGGVDGNTETLNANVDTTFLINKYLSNTELQEIYNLSNLLTCNELVKDNFINESIESTIYGENLNIITINSTSYVTVLSAYFNVGVNNTPGYYSVVSNHLSSTNNTITCRILIDDIDDLGSETSQNLTASIINSLYVTTEGAQLENGTHKAEYQCKIDSGSALQSVVVGIGHFQIDEDDELLNKYHKNISSTLNTTTFTKIGEYNFTVSDTNVSGDYIHALAIEWAASYETLSSSTVLLDSYLNVNGQNCSFYPVAVTGTGSLPYSSIGVSGDCIIKNVTKSSTIPIELYAKGVSSNFDFHIHNKEFVLHNNEIQTVHLDGITVYNGLTDLAEFNISNVEHTNANVFIKASFPFSSNETSQGLFRFIIADGFTDTSASTYATTTVDENIITLHAVIPNVGVDNYTITLTGLCFTGACEIDGGSMIAYVTSYEVASLNGFNVTVKDTYSNDSISTFNVTTETGAIYSAYTGWAFVFSELDLEDLIIRANYNGSYFPTYIYNHNTSNDLLAYANQSYVSWDCKEKISGNDLNCTSPTESDVFNYNVGSNPITQSINVTGYYEYLYTFNVTPLLSTTLNLSLYSTNLTLDAHLYNGSSIAECNYTLTGITYPSYSETVTGNTLTTVGLINGTYNISADCDGHAIINENITITTTTATLNFTIYTTNSFNITYIDIDTGLVLNGTNVTTQFIGATAFTNSTTSGSLYVDLLNPSEYTLITSANGYNQNSYIFTLSDRTFNELTIYLTKTNDTELVLITIKDKFSKDPVPNSIVTIQRYFEDEWKTDQILKTDFNGQTEGYFILSTAFYNFLVEKDGIVYFGTINSDENKKSIYAEDVTNGIIIEIDTSPDTTIASYQTIYDIVTSCRFTNTSNTTGYFIFTFDDTDNIQHDALLEVTKDGTVICTNTLTDSESGNMNCLVNVTDSEGIVTFYARGYLDGVAYPIDVCSGQIGIDETRTFDWGVSGFFLGLFLVIIALFAFATVPSMSIMAGTGMFVLSSVFNLMFGNTDVSVLLMMLFAAFMLAKSESKGGVNA